MTTKTTDTIDADFVEAVAIDYSKIPPGRLGPRASGGTASIVIIPSRENGGTIGLYVYEDVGGNSWPMAVHHGRAVKLGRLVNASGESVGAILREHEAELRAIDAAYLGARWDGCNHVGRWDQGDLKCGDLSDAPIEMLTEALTQAATYWSASDWLDQDHAGTVRDLYEAMANGRSLAEIAAGEAADAQKNDALVDADEIESLLQEAIDGETTASSHGVALEEVCARRYAALLAARRDGERTATRTPAEAAAETREVLPIGQRTHGVVRDGRFVLECECGQITTEPCLCPIGDSDEAVVVEWMPHQHRADHEAADNCGVYPHNGAIRVVCLRECADDILDDEVDGPWSHLVGSSAVGAS